MPSTTQAAPTSTPAAIAPDSVYKVVIKAPVRAVWSEITRTDVPIACFFNSRMHLGPGGLSPGTKLAMRTPDAKHTGVVGEILEIIPLKRFSHTFKFASMDEPPCVVTYDLREVPEGTEFILTISKAIAGSKTLKAVLETGKPTLGVRLLYRLFAIIPAPKSTRSEHWPVD